MRKLLRKARAIGRDSKGATAIEYGLIAAGIFLAIVPPVTLMGDKMDATYQAILDYFSVV